MIRLSSLFLIPLWFLPLAASSLAQNQASSPAAPADLVRNTVENELKSSSNDHALFRFRGVKTTPRGSTTRIYVETREATAGLIVGYNGKPLSPEQRQAEFARVERFLHDPAELEQKRKQEKDDAERTFRIVRAIPDALLFEYAGEATGSTGLAAPGVPLVKLAFRPNPHYEPPSRIEQVLTGLQGYLLIDRDRRRIALIDGTLFKEVSFGWGILGHLNKGGHFLVQQQVAADGYWEISRMTLDLTGKILLFKNLDIKTDELFSDFRQVPSGLTFAQAVDMLKKEEASLPENNSETGHS